MKIAIAQTRILYEDKEYNYKKAYELIKSAVGQGANLVLFPEMSFTGFSMNISKIGENCEETIDLMKEYAQQLHINIGFGWVKNLGIKGENHYTIVDEKNTILLDYIKWHPFSYAAEDQFYIPGNKCSYCNLNQFVISVAICYDLRFPELFQIQSKKANIILVPANWPEVRVEQYRVLLRARAIENQCYIVGINCVGEMNDQYYSGDSCVIQPDGTILKELSNNEGLILIEIQNTIEELRFKFPVKKDRRELLYKEYFN